MKAALIGAASSVGSRIVESFQLGAGPTLAAVARHPAEFTSAARFPLDLRVADFTQIDSLARSFSGCSAVIYIPTPASPAEMKRAAVAICRAAAQAGVKRSVFVGSADVHGLCPAIGTDEKTALQANHPDDAQNGLVLAEKQFLAECRQLNVAGYALRAGFLYGPRVPAFAQLASALAEERAWLLQRGDGICNCVYLDHLVSAVLLTLKTKAAAGSAYLVMDSDTITWRDLFHAVAHQLHASTNAIRHLDEAAPDLGSVENMRFTRTPFGQLQAVQPPAPPLSSEMIARQQCRWKLPITRAHRELNYNPGVSPAEAIRRSCAWWRFAQGEFSVAA